MAQIDESIFTQGPGEWERRLTDEQGLSTAEARLAIWRRCTDEQITLDGAHLTVLVGMLEELDVELALAVLPRVMRRPRELQSRTLYPLTRPECLIIEALADRAPEALSAAEAAGHFEEPVVHGVRAELFLRGLQDDLAEETLARLANNYLEPTRYEVDPLFERLQTGPLAERWRQAQVQQFTNRSIYTWSPRAEALLQDASDEDLVALCESPLRGAGVIVTRAIERRASLRARVEARLAAQAHGPWRWLLLLMDVADGQTIDPSVDDELLGHMASWGANHEVIRALLHALPTDRALELTREAMQLTPRARRLAGYGARVEVAQELFGLLHDRELYELALEQVNGKAQTGVNARWRLRSGFLEGGEYARAFALEALERKNPATVTVFLLEMLGQLDPTGATSIAITFLDHSARAVRDAAIERLVAVGEPALAELRAVLVQGRKQARQSAVEVVRRLPETEVRQRWLRAALPECAEDVRDDLQRLAGEESSALDELAALRQAITSQERITLQALWKGWLAHGIDVARLRELGMKALLVLHEELSGYNYRRKPGIWVEGALALRDAPLMPWAVASAISTMVEYTAEPYLKSLPRIGNSLIEPLLAMVPTSPHRARLLELLGRIDAKESAAVLIDGLSDGSRPVRDAAIEGLVRGGSPLLELVIAVLGSRKKDARQAAAEVLAQLGDPAAAAALEAAIATERSPEVATVMRRALTASAPVTDVEPETDPDDAIARWLAGQAPAELPAFVRVEALPPLRFLSGQALPDRARLGWIGQLSLETDEQPNLLARRLRARFIREDVVAFGEGLLRAWETDGESNKHRWALEQMAISASEVWIYEVGRTIRATWSHRQSIGKVHLGILARHDSPVARFWLMRAQSGDGWSYRKEAAQAYVRRGEYEGLSRSQMEARIDPDLAREADDIRSSHNFYQNTVSFWRNDVVVRARLVPSPVPAPGDFAERFALPFHEISSRSGVASLEGPEMRRAVATAEEMLRSVEQDVARWLQELRADAQRGRRWTVAGWRRTLVEHAVLGPTLERALFETTEPSRQRFGRRHDGSLVDIDGEPVVLPDGVRITLVLPETVTAEDRERWRVTLADSEQACLQWIAEDLADRHESGRDAFGELRALLYDLEEGSTWGAICALLSTWPDETLQTAIEYTQTHLEDAPPWNRLSPPEWAASVLSANNPQRAALIRQGKSVMSQADPRLRLCGVLRFDGARIHRADAVALSQSPHLAHIRRIVFYRTRIYADAIPTLTERNPFPSAEQVIMTYTTFGVRMWQQLLGAPWMRHVTAFDFSDCSLGDDHIVALAESGRLHGVTWLSLGWNRIGTRGIEALANCPDVQALETLNLTYNRMGPSATAALAASPHLTHLTTLTLDGNELGEATLERFLAMKTLSDETQKSLQKLRR